MSIPPNAHHRAMPAPTRAAFEGEGLTAGGSAGSPLHPYVQLAIRWGVSGALAAYLVYSLVEIVRTDMRAMASAVQEAANAGRVVAERVEHNTQVLTSHEQTSEQTANLLRAVCYNNAQTEAERSRCATGISTVNRGDQR